MDVIKGHSPTSPNPLFLFFAPHGIHEPLQAPQAYFDKFDFIEVIPRRRYAGMVSHTDDMFGNVVAALKAQGTWRGAQKGEARARRLGQSSHTHTHTRAHPTYELAGLWNNTVLVVSARCGRVCVLMYANGTERSLLSTRPSQFPPPHVTPRCLNPHPGFC